jgi:hypothetical protein
MTHFEVYNTTSGHSFGIYPASDEQEAFAMLLQDAGALAIDPDLDAKQVYAITGTRVDVVPAIQDRLGDVATREEAEAMYDQGEQQDAGYPVWFVRDWDKAVESALEVVA